MREFIQNLKISYHSGFDDNLGKDFYSPCLSKCNEYKRTTGDFTSNVIFDWGEALINIIEKDEGKCIVKIIANPNLAEEDKIALSTFVDNQNRDDFYDKVTHNIFRDALDIVEKNLNRDKSKEIKLKIFCYLIATRKLILKFGFPKHVHNANVFHTKCGIFYFDDNLKVGFSGSSNETHGGHLLNIEHIHAYHNLDKINPYIEDIEEKFELSWEGKAPGFDTRKLNKKTLDLITSYAPNRSQVKEYVKKFKEEFANTKVEVPENPKQNNFTNENVKIKENYLDILDQKWSFQEKARKIFIEKKWGLLEMATGTGKTRTALAIATQLINENKVNKIILQMKGSDLIDQWDKNVKSWLQSKINRSVNLLESTKNKDELDSFLLNFNNREVDLLLLRQSNLPILLNKLEKFNLDKTLIIHDEVHDLFAEKISEQVIGKQNRFGYKLGLSATIREPFDKEREKILFKEIQGGGEEPIYTYSLIEAIKDGVLVESVLEILTYRLYKDESAKIGVANARCATRIKEGWLKHEAEAQRNMEVADVRKNARNKIEVFEENINYLKEKLKRSFVFTDEKKYGNKILNILTPYLNVKTHFQDSDKENLKNFSDNKIDCIINVLKLSQGIDIQNLNTIVLFATPTGRQFVQRVGRVLRKDHSNVNKKAIIIDFFDEHDLINENENSTDYKRYLELKKITETKYEPR